MRLLDSGDSGPDTTLNAAPAAPTVPATRTGSPAVRLAAPPVPVAAPGPRPGGGRPRIDGKFIAVGGQRLWVRGVTYGTFAPDAAGDRFPGPEQVARDFAGMAAAGINAVRVYTVPPRRLLDAALDAGLWMMVGLPWEQHVAFLTDRARARSILARVRAGVAACAGHPAVLCYAVGNEIPAPIVRFHGRRRVERFLERLCAAARAADPAALLTYVSFPSTEYLRLESFDILSFNVYLEDRERLAGYVARLQNLAGERPLMLAEIGLDSARGGAEAQAQALAWQVEVAFSGGCAGTFVFAWTDAWHRGEDEVTDWDFGLTDRQRRPKPALRAVRRAYAQAPPRPPADAPLISVVVCTYNGAATLRECLAGVRGLRYPRFETIVVDDGSTDASAAIGRELGARVLSGPNRGLSAARNTGLHAARGELVAYLDDDASPDADWLSYLAAAFASTEHAAVGGPNLPPPDETGVAACVANAPGGPVHVLLTDTVAEHLPGCNMAFRREALLAIGGFDPQFRVAGDDVDVCWRLQQNGETLGFHAAAMVWHRRRTTIRRFWRQQRGYGKAEALLERKWPEKYNVPGHATWGGRLYGRGFSGGLRRSRVYHGTWGTGAFQSEVPRALPHAAALTATPEWYLVVLLLGAVTALGLLWTPLALALPLAGLAAAAVLAHAAAGARRARFGAEGRRRGRRLALQALTGLLHLLQPAARLAGRLHHGLAPWRRPRRRRFALPTTRERTLWSEVWRAPEERLRRVDAALRGHGERVRCGGPCDRWDLQVAGGALGAARLLSTVEDHGRGRQLIRVRISPRIPAGVVLVVGLLSTGGGIGVAQGEHAVGTVLLGGALALLLATVAECGNATAGALRAVEAAVAADETRPTPIAEDLA